MTESNRTEVAPAEAEKPTAAFQHLKPALEASKARMGNEEMVMAMVPQAFAITLSDGTRQRVHFEKGNYPIPKRFKSHYYLKANGVTFGDDLVAAEQKPQLEGGADPAAAAAAAEAEANRLAAEAEAKANRIPWPTNEEIEAADHEALGEVLKAHGCTEDDLKEFPSAKGRRAKIREMITAEVNNGA